MSALETQHHKRSRYVVRRFVPALVLMLALNVGGLFVDVSLVHWIAAVSGCSLAIYLFFVKLAAEKRYPFGPPE